MSRAIWGAARCLVILLLLGLGLTAPAQAMRPTLEQPLTVRWRYASDATINLTPAVRDERIYLPLARGELLALDAANGGLLWKNDTGGEISCTPETDNTAVFVAAATGELSAAHGLPETAPKGSIRAVSRTTGLTLWTRSLPTPLYGLLVANEQAVFGVAANGAIYALAKTTGEMLWTSQLPATLTSDLTISQQRLYIGSKEGWLMALDAATGRLQWKVQLRGVVRGHIWAASGTVYAATDSGQIVALNETGGGLRWEAQAGPSVQALAVNETGVYAASFDNSLYVLNLAKGKRLWRKQLGSRVAGAPLAVPEGVLLTSMIGNVATVLHPRDGKIVNTINLEDDGSTAAAPVFVRDVILITGRKGLLAFANTTK